MPSQILLFAILAAAFVSTASAQIAWPKGKTAALVFTYDDALRSQLDIAIPQLDAAKLQGHLLPRRRPDSGGHVALA